MKLLVARLSNNRLDDPQVPVFVDPLSDSIAESFPLLGFGGSEDLQAIVIGAQLF